MRNKINVLENMQNSLTTNQKNVFKEYFKIFRTKQGGIIQMYLYILRKGDLFQMI